MKQINCRETRAVMSLCLSLEMIESMLLPGQRPIRTIKQNNGESSRPQSHTYKTAVIWPVMQPSCVDRDKMTANSSDTSSVLFHFPLTFFSQPKECIHIKQGRNFISVSAPDPHFCPPKQSFSNQSPEHGNLKKARFLSVCQRFFFSKMMT